MSGLFTLALLVFFVLSVLFNENAGRLRLTLATIVLGGTLQALYGSFMTLSGLEYGFLVEKTEFRGVATGTFNARNMLAERNWGERLRLTLDAMLALGWMARRHDWAPEGEPDSAT